ncbi:hypothetical protein [Aeromicrobium massiliense]|uniref:hypothetical protein n=1 Tax=Aeromicrobium massiliense TaxID=1464554 RepID=UPI000578A09A|nr:hypothetical protein [Aeromicrobium massiliense]
MTQQTDPTTETETSRIDERLLRLPAPLRGALGLLVSVTVSLVAVLADTKLKGSFSYVLVATALALVSTDYLMQDLGPRWRRAFVVLSALVPAAVDTYNDGLGWKTTLMCALSVYGVAAILGAGLLTERKGHRKTAAVLLVVAVLVGLGLLVMSARMQHMQDLIQ